MISLFFKSTEITGIRDHPDAYGDIILHPVKAVHAMTLNGACTLQVTLAKQLDAAWEVIDTGDVFSVPVPWSKHRQLFRCYEFDKDSDHRAVFYCRHILFDLAGYDIIDARPTMQNGQGALAIALNNTPFVAHSNITATSTAYWVRKRVTEALWSDDDNSFANRWGGEYLCDNYDLYINEKVGTDRGVRIEYRRNLEAIKVNKSEDDVVTRIIPVGYDGIMLDGDTPWVDSPLINAYPVRHDSVITFDDIKYDPNDEDAYPTLSAAQSAMIARCNQLFTDGIDKPSISYSVSMVDLSKLDAYRDYKILETVSIGDTVHVNNGELDINVDTRIIAYEYDCLEEEYTSLTLDSVLQSYFGSTSNIQSKVNSILNSNGSVNGAAISGVIDAFRTKIRAQRNVEQLQDVRAILFEDTIAGSPTYGAMSLGTQGFAIASEMLPDGSDWDWRTFGTGQGFVADLLAVGKIVGQCAEIGLDNATFLLGPRDADGVISSPVMSYQDGVFELNVSGTDVGNQLDEMKTQIDGKIESWYQSTDPSLRWATIAAQTQHTGDLWYKTTDQTTWRWTGTAWVQQDAPAAVFDAIDGKSAIYVSQPTPPYEVGDLWAQGSGGDLMRCTTARSSGSYTASDWTKASKYTDDTAITNFITGDYADDLDTIRGQVDAKAETWYQAADPSTAWTTTAIKTQHTGDLWYKTTDQTTWRWTGTAWTQQDAPAAVFDAIDGKSAIYVSQPTPPYEVGDLWVLAADTTISALPYTKGTVLVATTARATGSFVATDWTQKIDIATWLSNQINTDTGAIDAIKVIIDSSGLTLKNIIGTNVFYADVSGNLTLAGTLQAAKGTFIGEVRNYESNGYIGLSMTGSQLKFYSKNYQDNFIGGIENKGKGTSETDKLKLHIYADSGDQLSIGNNTSGVRDQISMSDNGDTWILHPRNNGSVYLGGYNGDMALAAKVQSGATYVDIFGKLTVYNGAKDRAVKTKNYGIVNLGAYETTTPMFGDIGYAVIQEDGKVYVCIDPIFCECLEDSGVFYHVFTQAYGDGRIEKVERHEEYFAVYGDPGTELSWEIKARQQQFCERLADGNRIEEKNEEMQIIDGYLMGDAYMAEYTNSIIDDAESYITEYEEVNL